MVFRLCLTLVPDNSEVDMAEIKTQTPESQKSESANNSCCTGITRRDLEVINQRLGSLEAQAKRSETVGNKTTIVGGDDRNNVGFRDKVRRKPIKTSSFNDRSSSKSRRRSPYRHTVPSDRDETARIEEFRTECISKALKCNTVDIVNSYTRKENPVTFLLPVWLSDNDMKLIKKKSDIKYQCRTLLVRLREKDFDTVRRWIQEESGLDKTVINHIWKTFEEFNDTDHILKRMCIFCKLKLKVNISDIIDHLCSIEIISDELYHEINSSSKRVGSQDILWMKLAEQCKSFSVQCYVKEALRIALTDVYERAADNDRKEDLQGILKEMTDENGEGCDIFECKCKAICSRELQPMSLLKPMSLVNVYSSPQAKRKTGGNRSYQDRRDIEVTSSASSNESIANSLKMNTLKYADNETFQRESIDDRFISLQNSNRSQFIKRRSRQSRERKCKESELTYRKELLTASRDKNFVINQFNDTDGESLKTMTANGLTTPRYPPSGKNDFKGSVQCELDTTISSDNDEHPAKYRGKTHDVFRKQTNAKEKRNFKINIISPAQVNIDSIKSTLLTQGRHSSTESASN